MSHHATVSINMQEIENLLDQIQEATFSHIEPLIEQLESSIRDSTRERLRVSSREAKEACLAEIAKAQSGEERKARSARHAFLNYIEWGLGCVRRLASKVRVPVEEVCGKLWGKCRGFAQTVCDSIHLAFWSAGLISLSITCWAADVIIHAVDRFVAGIAIAIHAAELRFSTPVTAR